MVQINGRLVPPLGGYAWRKQDDEFFMNFSTKNLRDGATGRVKIGPDGIKSTDKVPGGRKRKDGKIEDISYAQLSRATKPNGQPFGGGAVSVLKSIVENQNYQCKAVILVHVSVTAKESKNPDNRCGDAELQGAVATFERAMQKLAGDCYCPEPMIGKRSVEVRLVWHPEPVADAKTGRVVNIRIDCSTPLKEGTAHDADLTIDVGDATQRSSQGGEPYLSVIAHEIGHILFGTHPGPEEWGRNPHYGDGLMRDTELPDRGLVDGDRLNSEELCLLCTFAGLVESECCWPEVASPKKLIPRTGSAWDERRHPISIEVLSAIAPSMSLGD